VGGGTPSPQLALILFVLALVLAIAALAVTLGTHLGRRLARWVGAITAIVGIGGLVYVLVVSLFVSGAFPLLLLTPDNLSGELWLAFAAITGIGLFRLGRHALGAAPAAETPWIARSWHPVALGIALGIGLGALWSAVIYPLIPYECCLII
jgi:hypothetical protein